MYRSASVGLMGNEYPFPQAVLRLIEAFPKRIFLTGSQWLGTATPKSDWDFIITNCPDSQRKLRDLGFVRMTSDNVGIETLVENVYGDISVVSCWTNQKDRFPEVGPQIHIQLVKDAPLKAAVQAKIAGILRKVPDKKARADVWKAAMLAVEAIDSYLYDEYCEDL